MTDNAHAPKYVLGDWGTSHLRLFLLQGDVILDTRTGPGIAALASAPAEARIQALAGLVSSLTDDERSIEVVLCGMAGSRNGLLEVPYTDLPADCASWSRESRTMQTRSMHITIAAGVRSSSDVMRGEETQVFGAMQLDADLGDVPHVVLLPGTHSKWVELSKGSITRFRTVITGELYALLHDHSTLLKTGRATPDGDHECIDDRDSGFRQGIERSSILDGGLAAALFETRAAQLLDQRSKAWTAGYLSGLLIGHEVSGMSDAFQDVAPLCIIGEPKLVSLYRTAFKRRGIELPALDGAECALAGLRLLREQLAEN